MARITHADLESLRMPRDPMGNLGLQDIEALKAATWGSDYDVDARRAKIAEAMLAQQIAALAPTGGDRSNPSVSQLQPFMGGDPAGGYDGSQGVSGTQAGDRSGIDVGALFGSSTPGFHEGAPPGNSMFGDRASFEPGGSMMTANASMIGDPLGESGAQSVSVFGREGDDSSQQSQGTREAQAQDFAMSAFGRESLSDRSMTAPGWGRGGEDREGVALTDVSEVAENAPGYTPDFDQATPNAAIAVTAQTPTPGWAPDFNDTFSQASRATPAYGGVILSNTTTIPGVPSFPNFTPDVPLTPTPTPSQFAGRNSPVTPNSYAPTVPTTPGIPSPGAQPGGSGGGFGGAIGGFSESSPGGYSGGPGSVSGFGAGHEGSASFGNTQGAQGFTTGGFSTAAAAGAFSAGFEAGATAAMGGQGADPGGGAGAGSGEGGGASAGSGGSDPGGSPGGVG